jgi:hypothetical protein
MSEDDCTCGLYWRVQLQTEREMHNAWRKRAEEAERPVSPTPRVIAERIMNALADGHWLNNVTATGTIEITQLIRELLAERPVSPSIAAPAPQRYRIMGDDSGHEYFIPVDDEGMFEAWVAYTEEVHADLGYDGEDFEENRIDGRFTFTDPRNE